MLSPAGAYQLWTEDDIFVLNPKGVDGSFFSDDIPELEGSVSHNALYASWRPDSRMVAVCIRTGKCVEDTFMFRWRPHDLWRCLRLPYYNSDSQAVPLNWLDATSLIVEMSGPLAPADRCPLCYR